MTRTTLRIATLALSAVLVMVAGCGKSETNPAPSGPANAPANSGLKLPPRKAYGIREFSIVSGSENKALEPILTEFARANGVDLHVHYKGSVDIMLELESGKDMPYDAIWPANTLWITLGDVHKVIRHEASVMHSPVVFGVRQSVARELGWTERDIQIKDVLAAAEAGKLRFAMTSATQSNSGASAYFGFLHALAGSPDVLAMEHLNDPDVQEMTRRLLKQVNRSSGSSGWLKEMLVESYDTFDAMVNYESMIIEANQELTRHGKEPLIAVYPLDGIMLADSPLGFVAKGDIKKEAFFQDLLAFLLTESVQKRLLGLGRRTGIVGFNTESVDSTVFNPAWGIDVNRVISPVPTPTAHVIRVALNLYQSGGLRKPSATAYVLDFSGSMRGDGQRDLKKAMELLLDRTHAERFYLQPSPGDLHLVIPFDSSPRAVLKAQGNDEQVMASLLGNIRAMRVNGGTDIYAATASAIRMLRKHADMENSFPAVILMTDGKSKGSLAALRQLVEQPGEPDIPVFSITFGTADDRQLKEVSRLTGGRVFHGHSDLARAFRKAKGYN